MEEAVSSIDAPPFFASLAEPNYYMLVLIAGGGRTGSHLASLLLAQVHEARLVEARADTLINLHRELPTEAIFEGDPTDPAALVTAGIERAHVLAAVTAEDADNLIITSLARFHYNVRRIIGRVNNPRNAWLFTPASVWMFASTRRISWPS
jgi:trk system potassium uptake protein